MDQLGPSVWEPGQVKLSKVGQGWAILWTGYRKTGQVDQLGPNVWKLGQVKWAMMGQVLVILGTVKGQN